MGKDLTDSSVVAIEQVQQHNRGDSTDNDDGAVSMTYESNYQCVEFSTKEEDDAIFVENN